ncbi:MAG TPA: hypothetical protein VFE51_02030 [Verrucomicrobiae bacterium]|nr:hypothetical protein [Verrucomicrobiae bacterium]
MIRTLRFAPVFILGVAGLLIFGCATRTQYTVEEYRKLYNKPLLSSGAQFAALPPAVQNTVRAETGSATIEEVVKDTSLGRIIYRISFANSNLFEPLNIAPDGSLLDPDLIVVMGAPKDETSVITGSGSGVVSLNDLPPAAVKAMQRSAPDAQVDSIVREVSGDQTVYQITFKDQLHPPLRVAADGTILTVTRDK